MNRLRVLMYHRVAERQAVLPYEPRLVSAGRDEFERQMAWLAKRYTAVSLEEIVDAVDRKAQLPAGAVHITFDDAYADFALTAWPILQGYGLPVTLFVPTEFPGNNSSPFWWDELRAMLTSSAKSSIVIEPLGELPLSDDESRSAAATRIGNHVKTLPHPEAMQWLQEVYDCLEAQRPEMQSTLTWDELRSLASQGVAIAAHSRSHPLLTRTSLADLDEEIAGSQSDVQREIGSALPVFCYPSGAYNDDVEAAVARAGMRIAFTTETGHNDLDRCNPLALRRMNVTPRTTMGVFRIKLSAPGAYADRLRKALRH